MQEAGQTMWQQLWQRTLEELELENQGRPVENCLDGRAIAFSFLVKTNAVVSPSVWNVQKLPGFHVFTYSGHLKFVQRFVELSFHFGSRFYT